MAWHLPPSVPSTSATSWRAAPAPSPSPGRYSSPAAPTCSTSISLPQTSPSMTEATMSPSDLNQLNAQLEYLRLSYIQDHYQALADKAAEKQRSHLEYLAQLVEGEAALRENRSIERRIKNAYFPVLKTLDDFQWSWPKKINRPQIQNLFRLAFIASNTNVVFISTVGLGKTHIALALGHAACVKGYSVLFTTAVDIINTLAAAQTAGRLKREFRRYLNPALLIIDELGYL